MHATAAVFESVEKALVTGNSNTLNLKNTIVIKSKFELSSCRTRHGAEEQYPKSRVAAEKINV